MDDLNSKKLNPEEDVEEVDVVELLDENGESSEFEHIATLEHEGATYLALAPYVEDAPEDADIEIAIFRIDQDENGEDIYTTPEDDVQEAVFEKLMSMMEEMEEN